MAVESAANATKAKKALEKIASKGKDLKKQARSLAKNLRKKNKAPPLIDLTRISLRVEVTSNTESNPPRRR
jgi:predicted  nucleic acid-binding Zn ribbon protein